MTDFPFATVGFDLDGTLLDTNRDLCPAINYALGTIGRSPVPFEQSRKLIGGGSKVMMERALEETGGPSQDVPFDELYARFLHRYEAHIADETRPYPGVIGALDQLDALGCKLAVVTNKPEHLTRKLFAELGLTDRFVSIVGGDTLGPGRAKPAPDMVLETIARCGGDDRFAMVGDSSFDVQAAHAAGKPCAVFRPGYHDMPPDELGGDATFDHFDELVGVLRTLG